MRVFAWSYTALAQYNNCPRQYYLDKVEKELPFVETAAMREGNEAHLMLAKRVTEKRPLPPELAGMERLISGVEAKNPTILNAEKKLALNRNFEPTGYFEKDTWLRYSFDLVARFDTESIVVDYKTGKRNTDLGQLRLFAAIELETMKHVQEVRVGYAWTKTNQIDVEKFNRAQLPDLWAEFLPTVREMEQKVLSGDSNSFPPKPSGLCAWCPCNLTQCEFKVERG